MFHRVGCTPSHHELEVSFMTGEVILGAILVSSEGFQCLDVQDINEAQGLEVEIVEGEDFSQVVFVWRR